MYVHNLHTPYILKSNPHPNIIRTVFADLITEKKLVRGFNPHLSFNRPLPTRQTDWIILDVTNALTVIRLTHRVSSGHLTASGTNAPQLMIVTGWRIAIQIWVMTASLMNNKLQILYNILYIINNKQNNELLYCIVLTARTADLSFFQNPDHDRESNPHAILIRIWFLALWNCKKIAD